MPTASETMDERVAGLSEALCKAFTAVGDIQSVAARLDDLRQSQVNPSPIDEEHEELTFNLKLFASRAAAGIKQAQGFCTSVATRLAVTIDAQKAADDEVQSLRSRIAQMEVHQRKYMSSGLSNVMAAAAKAPLQTQAEPNLFAGDELLQRLGLLPRKHSTDNTDSCSCCPPGSRDGGDGTCVHRSVLASTIIDKTFDEQRRVMRRRLLEAEDEIKRLREGRELQEERSKNKALEAKISELRAEHDASRMKLIAQLTSRFEATAAKPAGGPSTADSQRQRVSSSIHLTALLAHQQLMSAMRDAYGTMKMELMFDSLADLVAGPPPPLSQHSSRASTPTIPPRPPSSSTPSLRRAEMPLLPSHPPPPTEVHVDVTPRTHRTRDCVPPPARRPLPTESWAVTTQVLPTPVTTGGSGVTQKPLHPRR